jgi:hypothetical protein
MNQYCIENLRDLQSLIKQMSADEFSKPLPVLSFSSIGQHVRHILELYLALEKGHESGIINYDKRKRSTEMEKDPILASDITDHIIEKLKIWDHDHFMAMEGDFGTGGEGSLKINTSLFREMAYNLEHSIHHQALIKIGCNSMDLGNLIDENFGVAPATIRFRQAQQLQLNP